MIVERRGARSDADKEAAAGQVVERGRGLREGDRPTDGGEGNGCRESHLAGVGEDGGERGGAVEPGFGEDEVVVGGEVAEAEVASGSGVLLEAGERVGAVAEVDEGEVRAVFHARSLYEVRGARC